MAGMNLAVRERVRGRRADLFPLLGASFSGIYLWHARKILNGRSTVLAAERNGEPVGLAMVTMLNHDVGYVYYLAVAPAERRQGAGGLLLDTSLEFLTLHGAQIVLAAVTRANIPSERLMASRGFRSCRFRDLSRRFGAFSALRLWVGMTVAPGENVIIREHLLPGPFAREAVSPSE
jgi:ribosomal protein S18 acetylase RimI-like enzyme